MADTKEWSDKGVKAEVDVDDAEIKAKDYGDPGQSSGFNKIRDLVNFEVVVKGTSTPVNGFPTNKPLTITVCYTAADAAAAGGDNKLKLGMWDGASWKNIPITKATTCPFPGFEGAYEAKITSRWADPPIAWGGGG